MPCYEIVTVATAAATPVRLVDLMKKCAVQVLAKGGNVRRFHSLGVRPLAVTKRKHGAVHDDGHFLYLCIDTNPKGIRDLEHTLRVSEDVVQWTSVLLSDEQQFASLSKKLDKAAKRDPSLAKQMESLDSAALDLNFGHPILSVSADPSRSSTMSGSTLSALGTLTGQSSSEPDSPLQRLQRSRDLLSQGGNAGAPPSLGNATAAGVPGTFSSQLLGGAYGAGALGMNSGDASTNDDGQVAVVDIDAFEPTQVVDDTAYLEELGITSFNRLEDVPDDVYDAAVQARPELFKEVGDAVGSGASDISNEEFDAAMKRIREDASA